MGKKRGGVGIVVANVKKTLCLDVQTARRLGSYACHEGLTESDVVTAALLVHLKGYQSFVRGRAGDPDGSKINPETGSVRLAEESA